MARRKLIPDLWQDTAHWPAAEPSLLPADAVQKYESRRKAMEEYVAGQRSDADICRMHGLSRSELPRLLKRCLAFHEDGRIWGFRALLYGTRVTLYSRGAKAVAGKKGNAGLGGAFSQLLRNYPQLREFIAQRYFKLPGGDSAHESCIKGKELHRKFLDECRRLGVPPTDYPFTTKTAGQRSLYAYLRMLDTRYAMKSLRARGSEEAAGIYARTGKGASSERPLLPFENVQGDGHLLDVRVHFELPTDAGPMLVELDRVWVLVVYERLSRAVLGYYISLNPEYTAADAQHCVLNCFMPPPRLPLTIEGLKYPEGGRFPSEHIPELAWVAWDEMLMDNAWAHDSAAFHEVALKVVGSRLCFGPPGVPERRAEIERWFGVFEEDGFHRLPMTTGSGPKDPRNRNPSGHVLSLDELRQLLDVLIAEYNHRPRPVLVNRTPLEILAAHVAKPGTLLRTIPLHLRDPQSFLCNKVEVTVRGNPKEGRRPYVLYEGVRYTNDVLARSPHLIRRKAVALVNNEDLRVLKLFLATGEELGYVTARGKWGVIPHSIQMRKTINRLKHEKVLPQGDGAIDAYMAHTKKQAQKSRRAASRFVRDTQPRTHGLAETPDSGAGAAQDKPTPPLKRATKTLV